MPFAEPWSSRIWNDHIKHTVTNFGMRAVRADDLYGPNILTDIWKGISESQVIIADITGRNPNVMYELGVAHAMGKDVVILSQADADIPFDLRHDRCLLYEDNAEGYTQLHAKIPSFLKDLLFDGLRDNLGSKIEDDDKVILILSTGGTCRCAMANMIMRHYLQLKKGLSKFVPISAGLCERTFPTMSAEAQEVLKARLDIDGANHKTLLATFPLIARADTILLMSSELLAILPRQFRTKAELFSSFLGRSEDIDDPYRRGPQAYQKCFELIESLVSTGLEPPLKRLLARSSGIGAGT
jgi:protein-tyrosine-phosphatase